MLRSIKHWIQVQKRRRFEDFFYTFGYKSFIRKLEPRQEDIKNRLKYTNIIIDVSVISRHDAATGIQRVVRSLVSEILSYRDDFEINIVLVAYDHGKYQIVRYGGVGQFTLTNHYWNAQAGDIFFGLDFSLDTVWENREILLKLRGSGVHFWFLMHDLLPYTHPHFFSRRTKIRFFNWLVTVGSISDGFFCVSRETERILTKVLANRLMITNFETYVIPMGCDLSSGCDTLKTPAKFDELIKKFAECPTVLMVGTIEPRKGYDQVLLAMDRLWKCGRDFHLVMVGAPGWKTAKLQRTLKQHPQNGAYLHWLRHISDDALRQLYEVSTGVLVASHAEGFGLPLIEAIAHGKPVLARDLPVFRSHEFQGLTFFPRDASPNDLSERIQHWIDKIRVEERFANNLNTWTHTAYNLLAHLCGDPVQNNLRQSELCI